MSFTNAFILFYNTLSSFFTFFFTPFDSIFGSLSWFEILFGAGLVVYIGYQFAKWLIDILP